MATTRTSANFSFLVAHDALLDRLGALAERYFAEDPATCLVKLRQFGEVLAQRTAARAGLYASTEESQLDLIRRLRDAGLLNRELADLFHGIRKAGDAAAHDLRGDHREALHQLLGFIEAAVKAGRLDRPKRGQVRAIKPDATTYTADDWRHALIASLGIEPTEREEAIRVAAEWARDHLGLEFSRLRSDGHIVQGLRSAINSAIRRGEVVRQGATHIARAAQLRLINET